MRAPTVSRSPRRLTYTDRTEPGDSRDEPPMRVVGLAGGLGTWLQEETDTRPKPMVEIGGRPIIWHIMKLYASFGLSNALCGHPPIASEPPKGSVLASGTDRVRLPSWARDILEEYSCAEPGCP